MKARAHFQQTGHSAFDSHPAFRRLCDPAQYLQQRALAGAIPANDAEGFALVDLKTNILGGPEVFGARTTDHGTTSQKSRDLESSSVKSRNWESRKQKSQGKR
jgi:hypothetical protein